MKRIVEGIVGGGAPVLVRTFAVQAEGETLSGEIVGRPGAWRPDTADRVDLLVLSVRQLGLVPLVFSFMGEQLARRVKNVATVRSYAVYVIAHARETALLEGTRLGLHEFLEPIAGQLLVLDVVRFVLVCKKKITRGAY